MFDLGGIFGGGGGDEEAQAPALPDYYLSDYYTQTQSDLYGGYRDVLAGELGPYYAPIGEYGGEDFGNLMNGITNRVTTNVSRSVDEDITRRNVSRGGVGTAAKAMAVASKVGDIESALAYSDYERALNKRGDLLDLGFSGLESVRTAGLTESEMRNKFNLSISDIESKNYAAQFASDEGTSDIWGNIMNMAGQVDWGSLIGGNKTTSTGSGASSGSGLLNIGGSSGSYAGTDYSINSGNSMGNSGYFGY